MVPVGYRGDDSVGKRSLCGAIEAIFGRRNKKKTIKNARKKFTILY